MQFFTDSKFQAGTAHSEYESYCRGIWDQLSDSLKLIQGGMLSEEFSDESAYCIHDGRILSCDEDKGVLLVISYNQDGDLKFLELNYEEGSISQRVNSQRLTNTPDDPDNDIMSHEVTRREGGYGHRFLFASGEEFEVSFSKLSLRRCQR